MPKMDGFLVLEIIRERRWIDDVPVVMISSELPEIMGASDRIIVLYEGRKMAEFNCVTDEITQEKLMETASGIAAGA